MQNNLSPLSPLQQLLQVISLLLVLFGFVIIGSVVFMQSVQLLLGKSFTNTALLFELLKSDANGHFYLLIAQMLTAVTSFILLPFLYLKYVQPALLDHIILALKSQPKWLLWVVLISIFSFPLIGFLAQLNKELLQLPPQFAGLTAWMQKSETEAKLLTALMVYFQSPLDFMLAILVIAVLPAVGEELLFRGIVQQQLSIIFNRPHLAIWVAGFLFSFIHFQFFGFIPRLFLGVLFGYIYYWSGNLWLPILMHFINNCATLLIVNWQRHQGTIDPLETEVTLPLVPIILVAIVFGGLIWNLKQKINSTTLAESGANEEP